MKQNEALQNPRIIVIQKLYAQEFNKGSELTFPTLERRELIEETIQQHLGKDLIKKRTEK